MKFSGSSSVETGRCSAYVCWIVVEVLDLLEEVYTLTPLQHVRITATRSIVSSNHCVVNDPPSRDHESRICGAPAYDPSPQ